MFSDPFLLQQQHRLHHMTSDDGVGCDVDALEHEASFSSLSPRSALGRNQRDLIDSASATDRSLQNQRSVTCTSSSISDPDVEPLVGPPSRTQEQHLASVLANVAKAFPQIAHTSSAASILKQWSLSLLTKNNTQAASDVEDKAQVQHLSRKRVRLESVTHDASSQVAVDASTRWAQSATNPDEQAVTMPQPSLLCAVMRSAKRLRSMVTTLDPACARAIGGSFTRLACTSSAKPNDDQADAEMADDVVSTIIQRAFSRMDSTVLNMCCSTTDVNRVTRSSHDDEDDRPNERRIPSRQSSLQQLWLEQVSTAGLPAVGGQVKSTRVTSSHPSSIPDFRSATVASCGGKTELDDPIFQP